MVASRRYEKIVRALLSTFLRGLAGGVYGAGDG